MRQSILSIIALLLALSLGARDLDVRKMGAKADGKTKVTSIIQKAIDEVSESGGGKVILSGGTFLSASLTLKSGVELYVDADATLLASADINDFPMREIRHCNGPETFPRWSNKCFILADEAQNIAISGRGKIDCNGEQFVREKTDEEWVSGLRFDRKLPPEKTLPRVVFLVGCKNVTVTDITMVGQPGGWTFWVSDCENAVFDRCRILANLEYPNNDGIHINSSRNVTVSNCMIETGDDCIVVRAINRTLKENKVCENVVVTNCTLRTPCYGIRISYVGDGVVRGCTFSNLAIYDSYNGIGIELPGRPKKNDYGLEESVVENLTFSNIEMSRISGFPIYVDIKDDVNTPVKYVRNIAFSNVHCTGYRFPRLVGTERNPLENFSFSNCTFTQMPYEQTGCKIRRRTPGQIQAPTGLTTVHCKGLSFTNTVFTTL